MIGMFCLSTFSYTSTRVIKQDFNSSALYPCPLSPVMASFISFPLFWLYCSVFLVWVHEMHQSPWPASTGQSFTPSSSSFSSLLGVPMPRLPFLCCDIFTSEHVSCVLALITDHKKNFRYLGSLFTFTLLREGLRDVYVGDREICCEMDTEP